MSNKYFKELVQQLLNLKNEKEMTVFLKGILTDKELEEIPTRLQIVKLLKKGVSQRKIAEKLKVGIATVTRGSKEIAGKKFENV